MKTSKYFTSEKRFDHLKKEKEEDDNEENEEEEDDEELDEKKKANLQNERSMQQTSTRPLIKKEIKSTIIKRDDRSKLITQTSNQNKSRVIQSQAPNQDINNSKEGMSIRRALQEKKLENHPITPASRIIQKTAQAVGKSQYTMKLTQNSSRTQIRTENPQIAPRPLKTQNSQTQLPIRPKITGKVENQNQAQGPTPLYHSRYSRRVIDSTNVQNDNNNKEIKIINKNNNYTINVTNNNNTINVTNNNNNEKNEDIKDKEEEQKEEQKIEQKEEQKIEQNEEQKEEQKEEIEARKIEPKREIKEPRREYFKESRIEERRSVTNNNYFSRYYNKEKEEKKEIENKEQINNENDNKDNNKDEEKEINNNSENTQKLVENKNEKKIKNVLVDRRKEYVTNDTMTKNGVEIVKFSPEETQKVYEKKKIDAEILRKKIKQKKKKNNFINRNNNNNTIKDYYDHNTHNYFKSNYIFYRRGRDNFSKRNIFERETFYKKAQFDDFNTSLDFDDYRDYNNKTFSGVESYTDIRGNNYINNRYNTHRRINNFYERGRPNPIFRGFRGRRGRY